MSGQTVADIMFVRQWCGDTAGAQTILHKAQLIRHEEKYSAWEKQLYDVFFGSKVRLPKLKKQPF